jgi:ankyrin repeat protein
MMACRVGDTKMVHLLMKNGASALQRGNKAGLGRTALFEIFLSLFDFFIKNLPRHWCAIHESEEITKIIVEYLREGGGL